MWNGLIITWALFLAGAASSEAGPASSRLRLAGEAFSPVITKEALGSISLWNSEDKKLSVYGKQIDLSGLLDRGTVTKLEEAIKDCGTIKEPECQSIACPDVATIYLYLERPEEPYWDFSAKGIQRIDVSESSVSSNGHRKLVPNPTYFVECYLYDAKRRNIDCKVDVAFGTSTIPYELKRVDNITNYSEMGIETAEDKERQEIGPDAVYSYDPRHHQFKRNGKLHHGIIDGELRRDTEVSSIGVAASDQWRDRMFKMVDQAISKYNEWRAVEKPGIDDLRRRSDELKQRLYAITHNEEGNVIRSPFGAEAAETSGPALSTGGKLTSLIDSIRAPTKDFRDKINSGARTFVTQNKDILADTSTELFTGALIVAFTAWVRYGPIPAAATGMAFIAFLEPASVSTILIAIVATSVYFFRRYPLFSGLGLAYSFGLYEGFFK